MIDIGIKTQEKKPLSVDLLSNEQKAVIQKAEDILEEERQSATAIGVTPERLRQMRAYAQNLRKKHPSMKPDRIKRKVSEYFKIKLT